MLRLVSVAVPAPLYTAFDYLVPLGCGADAGDARARCRSVADS